MATLDPRLLPLFETLIASRADWLVFELMDGIQAGIVSEEPPEHLATARKFAVEAREQPRSIDSSPPVAESRPIEGDEQIGWAAAYVARRLHDSLAMLDTSLWGLTGLVSETGEALNMKGRTVSFSLEIDGETVTTHVQDLGLAREALGDLVQALQRWVAETLDRRIPL